MGQRIKRGQIALALGSLLLLALVFGATATADTAPTPTIEAPTQVEYTTARFNGTINPNGGPSGTCWRFEFLRKAEKEAGEENWQWGGGDCLSEEDSAKSEALPVHADAGGLQAGTEYVVRLVAGNEGGETVSGEEEFETKAVTPPAVTIDSVGSITESGAHFFGTVVPNAPDEAAKLDDATKEAYRTSWHFECEPACGSPSGEEVAADNEPSDVDAEVTGLEPNKTYTVKLIATNAGGSTESTTVQFTTGAIGPTVATGTNTPQGPGQTIVRAYVNSHNAALTECRFEYGLRNFSQTAPCDSIPSPNNEATEVTASISGLDPGAIYQFRFVATNQAGTETSDDGVFTSNVASAVEQSCPNRGFLGSDRLPDCRAWEMVSSPDKTGSDVMAVFDRTRSAADGGAVTFASLGAFAGAQGSGVAVDYIAQRSNAQSPGNNGWSSHAITPLQTSVPLQAIAQGMDPHYEGRFSSDLSRGVFNAFSPLSDDPAIARVPTLYRRTDLRTAGPGSYQLISQCVLCAETGEALPYITGPGSVPRFAWGTPNLSRILFESRFRLTADTPAYAAACNVSRLGNDNRCATHVYEWDEGTLRLAGILPDGTAADVSVAGHGVGASHVRMIGWHAISDGSDGHSRTFFTQPTDEAGQTSSEVPSFAQANINVATRGNVYMRVDGSATEKLNLSERSAPDAFSRAEYLDASTDGRRVFFMTTQALTDDAVPGGATHLYMYDAAKPGSDPHNLTLLSPGGSVWAMIGASEDGHYVYFAADGNLVPGAPNPGNVPALYLWHDGKISLIARVAGGSDIEEILSNGSLGLLQPQGRVSPDGKHMLFSTHAYVGGNNIGPTGYDHGDCVTGQGEACRELYVYSADTESLSCASCNPGVTPTSSATVVTRTGASGASMSDYLNRPLSDDGRRVFFSSEEALSSEDTNGTWDAYQYDVETGEMELISSGASPAPSFFMEASPDGENTFFVTREQLSGWDRDTAYDLYDSRIGGGFPEPPLGTAGCEGEACKRASNQPPDVGPGSANFVGSGNRLSCHRHKHRHHRRHGTKRTRRTHKHCHQRKHHRHRRGHRSGSGR